MTSPVRTSKRGPVAGTFDFEALDVAASAQAAAFVRADVIGAVCLPIYHVASQESFPNLHRRYLSRMQLFRCRRRLVFRQSPLPLSVNRSLVVTRRGPARPGADPGL